jgi:hypothetical protein
LCILDAAMLDEFFDHTATKGCLFDDCEDRGDFSKGMQKGEICVDSHVKLNNAGIGDELINEFSKVLEWCKHNSFGYAIQEAIKNPWATLAFGTCAGWVSSKFLEDPKESFWLLGITAVVLFVSFWHARNKSN